MKNFPLASRHALAYITTGMTTMSLILKEIDTVPDSRLDELYQFIHALVPTAKPLTASARRKKILSYAGSFSDMADYDGLTGELKKIRAGLFNRGI